MRPLAWLFILLAFALPLVAMEPDRVWTNTQGRTMRAQFLREVDGEAVFLKDGKPVTVALDDLSEPDRQYIRERTSAQQADGAQDAAAANPFQPVGRPADAAAPFPRAADPVPSLVKKKTPIVNREWLTLDGSRTNGKFVRVYDRTVLIMRGLRTVDLPFDSLAIEDQNYVNQILIERGERPIPPLPPQPGSGLQSAPSAAGFPSPPGSPLAPEPHGDNQGPPAQPGSSQFFEQLRRRQEESRLEQAAHAAETAPNAAGQPPSAVPPHLPQTADSPAASADSPTSGAAAPASSSQGPGLVIGAKTLEELRPVLIVGAVVIGLFAIVGVIVFFATAVAGSNSRRQRRYL